MLAPFYHTRVSVRESDFPDFWKASKYGGWFDLEPTSMRGLELLGPPPPPPGRGKGLTLSSLSPANDSVNRACAVKPLCRSPSCRVGRASGLVSPWRCWEGGTPPPLPRELVESPHPFPHLFHLAVPGYKLLQVPCTSSPALIFASRGTRTTHCPQIWILCCLNDVL